MLGSGSARPGLALRYTAYEVSTNAVSNVASDFDASAATVTLYLAFGAGQLEIAPYLNVARFDSPNIDGPITWFAGGLMFSITTSSDPTPVFAPPPQAPYTGPPQG